MTEAFDTRKLRLHSQLIRHPWFDIHAWKLNKLSFFWKNSELFFLILQRLQNKLYEFSQNLLLARMFARVGRSWIWEDTKVRGENLRVKAGDHHIFLNTNHWRPQGTEVISDCFLHYATWTVNSITYVEISHSIY